MLYICEECGKKYATPEDAIKCEETHKIAKEKEAKLAKEKSDRLDSIQTIANSLADAISNYYDDYGNLPDVKFNFKLETPHNSAPSALNLIKYFLG